MNWLQRFLMGRHGVDEFSMALMLLALLTTFISGFLPGAAAMILELIGFAILAYGFFRILSRKHAARVAENMKFLKVWNPVKNWFKITKKRFSERKTHKYFRCPKCNKMLRVPKGIGKVNITCPECREKFIRKS